jgi:hypothetical protein
VRFERVGGTLVTWADASTKLVGYGVDDGRVRWSLDLGPKKK